MELPLAQLDLTLMPPVLTLPESIAELYWVFERYPLPADTEPCLCCHSRDQEALLHTLPLRQLGCDQLATYAFDALNVWGDIETFKHFLPRLFELLFATAIEERHYVDPPILFAKFRHAEWCMWSEEERKAVENFLHATWRFILQHPPALDAYNGVEDWLCAIGQAEDNLTHYLQKWLDAETDAASLALWPMMQSRSPFSPYWKGREAQLDQFESWLKSSAVLDKVLRSESTFDPTLAP